MGCNTPKEEEACQFFEIKRGRPRDQLYFSGPWIGAARRTLAFDWRQILELNENTAGNDGRFFRKGGGIGTSTSPRHLFHPHALPDSFQKRRA